MTKAQYTRMTERTRAVVSRLPGGSRALHMPTLLCALCYFAALIFLFIQKDARLFQAIVVPAACFLLVTALRPLIGRERPYDHFGVLPVGSYRPGKGKSMPSRHTASACAIACAVVYVWPNLPVALAMGILCFVIAALRVLSGQHYTSDVLAALVLSLAVSGIGYFLAG